MKKNQCYLPPKLSLLQTFFLEAKFTFWHSLVQGNIYTFEVIFFNHFPYRSISLNVS